MAVGVFPAAKLGLLAIKQISKPIANAIKDNAKKNPFFRKYVCMPPAQMYNWMEVKYKMWIMNLGKPMNVPQLTEAMAIELGANLLGEFVIFAIGAGVLTFEYVRSSNKEAKKEEAAKQEKLAITLELSELAFRVEKLSTQMRELTRATADLESRSVFNTFNPFHKKPLLPDEIFTDEAENFHGNYDPAHGIVFGALHYIETELFKNST